MNERPKAIEQPAAIATNDGEAGYLTDLHTSTLRFSWSGRVVDWTVETTLDKNALVAALRSYLLRKPGGSVKLKRFCAYAESKAHMIPGIVCKPYVTNEVPS